MHQIEKTLLFYLMFITVSIGINLKLSGFYFEHSRKDSTCKILRICTLVHVNQNFSDKVPFHFSRSC